MKNHERTRTVCDDIETGFTGSLSMFNGGEFTDDELDEREEEAYWEWYDGTKDPEFRLSERDSLDYIDFTSDDDADDFINTVTK